MAKLEKLMIQGIRSFGPESDDVQAISFFTPLTLILGPNGCGKTTIIECLKVATCGEYPTGSDKGKFFVHDPKVSNQMESRGQVRLKFFDARGSKMEVNRSMMTTQKAKTLQFKSLDQTITRTSNIGEPERISMRCADVDMEVCQALGVSKPILTNVLFCHQEDSTWPLEEGKKLKERFDAIFDATKYNKCVDTMRSVRKGMADKLKLLNKDCDMFKERKEELVEKQSTLENFERQLAVNKDQINSLEVKLKPIKQRLETLNEVEMNIFRVNTERLTKKARLQAMVEEQQGLRNSIEVEFKGTMRELEETIHSFKDQLQEKERSLGTLEKKHENLLRDENRIVKTMNAEQVRLGQLQNEEEQHKSRVDARNLNLNRLAQDLDVPIGTQMTQLNDTQVTNLLTQVKKKIGDNETELQMLRAQLESEEQSLQNKIDDLRAAKLKIEMNISSKLQEQAHNKSEARKVKKEIDEVDMSATKLAQLEAKLERAKRELDEVTKSNEAETLRAAIKESTDKRNNLEERLEVVNREVQTLQQRSSVQAELDVQKDAKEVKEAEIRRLRNKREDALKHLLKTVPEQGIKFELQSAQDKLAQDIRDLNNRLQRKQNELTTLETNRRHQREQLRSLEEELRVKEESVFERCKEVAFDEKVKNLYELIQDLQDQTGTLSSSEHIFRRYIQKLGQREPCCPLCHRGFNDQDEVTTLINELSTKIREFPTKLVRSKEELERMNKEYDRLQQLKPTNERISQLREVDIPKLRSTLQGTENSLATCRREVEDLQSSLMEPQLDEEMAREVHSDVVLIDQHQTEVRKLQREIERLEAKLPGGASGRNMQQALSEQEQLRNDLSATRRLVESSQHRLTAHNEHLQQLREQKNNLVEQQLKIQGGVGQRQQLQERLEELQCQECVLGEEVEALQREVGPARAKLEAAVREKEQAKVNNRETVDSVRKKLTDHQRRINEVERWQQNVDDYERRGMANKLTTAQSAVSKLEREKEAVRVEKDSQMAKIDAIKNELSSQQVRERELTDNLKLRQKMEEQEALSAEVAKLDERLGDLDNRSLQAEKVKLKREEDNIYKDVHIASGRVASLQETIGTHRRELQKDVYKNAKTNYRNAVIEYTVQKIAAEDLMKYSNVMETAMINFHQERMKTINGIIRDLWRQIYRGNDIDYIEIKTDTDITSTEKRRAYNYRVVQMKNGVEIDMRGRCSAGQKVLASLIIRMALAETFSANCGILALDEPTTNLDRDNIESLSLALADIVNARMVQKNFQLVIITHDEDFLESLTRVEKISHFYKVGRNRMGLSVISRHHISGVHGSKDG